MTRASWTLHALRFCAYKVASCYSGLCGNAFLMVSVYKEDREIVFGFYGWNMLKRHHAPVPVVMRFTHVTIASYIAIGFGVPVFHFSLTPL